MKIIDNKNIGYRCDKCKANDEVMVTTEDHIYCQDCALKLKLVEETTPAVEKVPTKSKVKFKEA